MNIAIADTFNPNIGARGRTIIEHDRSREKQGTAHVVGIGIVGISQRCVAVSGACSQG